MRRNLRCQERAETAEQRRSAAVERYAAEAGRMSADELLGELQGLRHDLEDARHDREKALAVVLKLCGQEQLERALGGDDHEGLGLEDIVKQKRREAKAKQKRSKKGGRR